MSQYIIDTLGWFLIIGAFTLILVLIGISVFLVTPLVLVVQFEREHRHGQMLELMDKQIELEKATRCGGVTTNPMVEVTGHESQLSAIQLPDLCEMELPDVPAPPA